MSAATTGRDSREKFLRNIGAVLYIDNSKAPAWLSNDPKIKDSRAAAKASSGTVLTDADVVKPFANGTGSYSQAATTFYSAMAAVRVNKTSGRVLVNDISSIYGKPGQQYQGWVNDGLLRYASDRFSKNDKPQPGTTVEASIASRGSPDQGLTTENVLTEADVVKYHQAIAGTSEQADSQPAAAVRDRILEEGSRRGRQAVQGATGEESQVANPQDPAAGEVSDSGGSIGGMKKGDRIGSEYVFHNTSQASLSAIETEGMDTGSFSRRPIDFGGNVWIAVKETDLPGFGGSMQEHSYGNARAGAGLRIPG